MLSTQPTAPVSEVRRILSPTVWKLIAAYGITAVTLLPLIYQWPVPNPRVAYTEKFVTAVFLVALGILYWIYRVEAPRLGGRRALTVPAMVLALSVVVNQGHNFNVDKARNYSPTEYNSSMQLAMHENVMKLNPGALPHVYRFLPNAFVRWIELGHVRFFVARDCYRFLFGILIFYCLYRYARLYTSFTGAILAMAITAAVFPVSFELYIGQLTDPMSHLSFLLALIFLETDNFVWFFTTLLIGSLAKESVLCLVGYYLLFRTRERNYYAKAASLTAMLLISYWSVRLFVQHGHIKFQQLSGGDTRHFIENILFYDWVWIFGTMIIIFVPVAVIGWKTLPLTLKRQYVFMIVVLWTSSFIFSWLHEGRNYMPAVFVTSVVVAYYCDQRLRADDESEVRRGLIR